MSKLERCSDCRCCTVCAAGAVVAIAKLSCVVCCAVAMCSSALLWCVVWHVVFISIGVLCLRAACGIDRAGGMRARECHLWPCMTLSDSNRYRLWPWPKFQWGLTSRRCILLTCMGDLQLLLHASLVPVVYLMVKLSTSSSAFAPAGMGRSAIKPQRVSK
jgi:hypothetical protein